MGGHSSRPEEEEEEEKSFDPSEPVKLLLLGAGESGKATMFKQLADFTPFERTVFNASIFTNVISAMKTLCNMAHGEYLQAPAAQAAAFVEDVKEEEHTLESIAQQVELLWAEPSIRAAYAMKHNFQLTASCSYFFEHIRRLASADYVPTYADVLRCRVRTTGIAQTDSTATGAEINAECGSSKPRRMDFAADDENYGVFTAPPHDAYRFNYFLTGGQRNERKKWIHCFDNVGAVVFVCAADEYDKRLYEDENTNRMHESLNLWEEVNNSLWFRDSPVVLCLNCCDRLQDELKRVPLTHCFPDYKGRGDNFEEAKTFILDQFKSRVRGNARRVVLLC